MNSTLSYDTMYRDWQKIVGKTTIELKKDLCSSQLPELQLNHIGVGVSALTIVDIETNEYLYVDESIERVTGCERELYLKKGAKYIFKRANYRHMPLVITTTMHQRRFFSKLPKDVYNDYIVSRELAYRQPGQEDKWVLHQVLRHLVNESGKLFAIAALQTDISILKLDQKFRYFIYCKSTNSVVYQMHGQRSSQGIFEELTKRESQILNLLKSGLSNHEIAKELCVSYHTVRTHRKRIFKKLNCRSIVDLLHFLKHD